MRLYFLLLNLLIGNIHLDLKYIDKITLKQRFLAKIPTTKDALLVAILGLVLLICIMTYVKPVGLAPYTILAII